MQTSAVRRSAQARFPGNLSEVIHKPQKEGGVAFGDLLWIIGSSRHLIPGPLQPNAVVQRSGQKAGPRYAVTEAGVVAGGNLIRLGGVSMSDDLQLTIEFCVAEGQSEGAFVAKRIGVSDSG